MAWTYTNDPSNVQLDAVRLLIGDVDGADPQLTNEELTYYLTSEGSTFKAAAAAARGLMSLYARKSDKSVGDLSISYSQRQVHYAALAADLSRRAASRVARPYHGGASKSDMDAENSDTDRVDPKFYQDQFEPVGTAFDPDTGE